MAVFILLSCNGTKLVEDFVVVKFNVDTIPFSISPVNVLVS